jgi:outer membrane PBP1 activator LpoA protein
VKKIGQALLGGLAGIFLGCGSDTPPTKNMSDAERQAQQEQAKSYQQKMEASQKASQKEYQENMKKGAGS